MLKRFKADLHIHTCLSPCAELKMTPSAIVKTASNMGLDIIAITDHNSAENLIAAKKAAESTGLTVLPGMEVTSVEEAHILAIFGDIDSVIKLQEVVYENLLSGENDAERFGDQVVVNEKDEVLGFNKRLLIAATTLSVHSVVNIIHSLGGLSIASHIDREVFGIISQLGFIPKDLKFDALEMSPNIDRQTAEHLFKEYNSFAWLSSSDAHYLKDIGKRATSFFIKEPTIAEITSALRNIDGRRVEWG
jgi:PHP family Zn ribbon phosphoesterase